MFVAWVSAKTQPETTALHEVVRDNLRAEPRGEARRRASGGAEGDGGSVNLETLKGAIGDGAIAVRIPKHRRKELESYLDRGPLCRGFARLKREECGESRLVAFSCRGRGYAERRNMRRREAVVQATGSDAEPVASRRRRLAQDGALLGRLTRIAVETLLTFYAARAGQGGGLGEKRGAVTALQRTLSDLRLNPHLHMIALDGTWCKKGRRPRLGGARALWVQRGGRGAGAPGTAHGETPSPDRQNASQ